MVRKVHYWGNKQARMAVEWNRPTWEIEQLPELRTDRKFETDKQLLKDLVVMNPQPLPTDEAKKQDQHE